MRKILMVLLVFLCICNNLVFADDVLFYDVSSITRIGDTELTIEDYYHDVSDYSYTEDDIDYYAIYATEDLTLNVYGTNTIEGPGIYVGGDLIINGTGTLNVDNLVIEGEVFVCNALTVLTSGSDSYYGPKLHYPNVVFYNHDGLKLAQYNAGEATYKDYLDLDSINNFTIFPACQQANLNNLYVSDHLYKYNNLSLSSDIKIRNVNGFIVDDSYEKIEVNYDPTGKLHGLDAPVYDVMLFDDLSLDEERLEYFELAFEDSEWGKYIEYKVLASLNAYEYKVIDGTPTFNEFVVGNTYKEIDGLVGERSRYAKSSGGDLDTGTSFYVFAVKNSNFLSVEVLGDEGSHCYINIMVVNTNQEDKPESKPNRDFVIPNTGIK